MSLKCIRFLRYTLLKRGLSFRGFISSPDFFASLLHIFFSRLALLEIVFYLLGFLTIDLFLYSNNIL